MNKLEMVYVATRRDANGQDTHDIKTKDGSYMCRQDVANRNQAYRIAESIDAKMIYERDNGPGSIDYV